MATQVIDAEFVNRTNLKDQHQNLKDAFNENISRNLKSALGASKLSSLNRKKLYKDRLNFVKGMILHDSIVAQIKEYGRIYIDDVVYIDKLKTGRVYLEMNADKVKKYLNKYNWQDAESFGTMFTIETRLYANHRNLPIMYLTNMSTKELSKKIEQGIIKSLKQKMIQLEDKKMKQELKDFINKHVKGNNKVTLAAVGVGAYIAGTQHDKIKNMLNALLNKAGDGLVKLKAKVNKPKELEGPAETEVVKETKAVKGTKAVKKPKAQKEEVDEE